MDSLSGAWGSEWAGRPAGLAFSLPEEKPTWPAVTPVASTTAKPESTWPLTPATSEPDASTAERTRGGGVAPVEPVGEEVRVGVGTLISQDSDQNLVALKQKIGQFLEATTLNQITFLSRFSKSDWCFKYYEIFNATFPGCITQISLSCDLNVFQYIKRGSIQKVSLFAFERTKV